MKTILVVDDEFGNAESLALILEDEGYRVHCAANGRVGLDKVSELKPDVIVLDFMMPVMDGGEMGRQLRATPEFAAIKVVMQTSLPEPQVRARWDGYDAYLRKPFEVDHLLRVIRSFFAQE